jgi:hypothetical protein
MSNKERVIPVISRLSSPRWSTPSGEGGGQGGWWRKEEVRKRQNVNGHDRQKAETQKGGGASQEVGCLEQYPILVTAVVFHRERFPLKPEE